jgi:hypothetical protein
LTVLLVIASLDYSSRTSFGNIAMKLNARQSETLRDIRYLEMGGCGRSIDSNEAQALCGLLLVERQGGDTLRYRLTAKGWKALADAEEQLSLLVSV